jgi:gliding motility-associated-like protein
VANGSETYILSYVNQCPVSEEITVSSLEIDITANDVADIVCGNTDFEATITVNAQGQDYTVQWYKGNSPLPGKTATTLLLPRVQTADTGDYFYEVTTVQEGCQKRELLAHLTVIEPIEVYFQDPEAICEGDDVLLTLTATPLGTTIEWTADGTIEENITPLQIRVRPLYVKSGNDYQSSYSYRFTARLDHCPPKEGSIPVKIDEALNGKIESNDPVCEGASVQISADSYQADKYVWTSSAFEGEKSGSILNETLTSTSRYEVTVTRGKCTVVQDAIIEIGAPPRIAFIDSIDVRSREIVTLPGYGTEPFRYGLDDKPADNNPEKHDLSFGSHLFYVVDALGCRSTETGYLVAAPTIFPPSFFSPDGDGINDLWTIEGLAEIYPDAVITIYDRYGKKLAEYKGSADGWDGKYMGRDMPSTDYWYEIRIDEIAKQYVGHFTLLRK